MARWSGGTPQSLDFYGIYCLRRSPPASFAMLRVRGQLIVAHTSTLEFSGLWVHQWAYLWFLLVLEGLALRLTLYKEPCLFHSWSPSWQLSRLQRQHRPLPARHSWGLASPDIWWSSRWGCCLGRAHWTRGNGLLLSRSWRLGADGKLWRSKWLNCRSGSTAAL